MSNPTPSPDPDRLDAAVAAFRRMPVPDRPADEPLVARLAAGPAAEPAPPTRRRMLMRIATWSLAASVLAAAAAVLLFGGTPTVALADVVKAAEKHKLVKYKMEQTTEDRRQNLTGTTASECYADLKAPRQRTESRFVTLNGVVDSVHVTVQDGKKDRILAVLTETLVDGVQNDPAKAKDVEVAKQAGIPRREAHLRPVPGDAAAKARTLLDNLRELERHKDARATKDTVGGREAVKYRIEDGNKTTQLWIDAKTKLPVRMEFEIVDGTPDIPRNTFVFTDFEWDPEVKGFKSLDELFDTTPPAGYALTDETKGK